MQNYTESKVNGTNERLKLLVKIESGWLFEDLYKITINEQRKIERYDTLFGTNTRPNIEDEKDISTKLFYKYQPTNYSFLEYLFQKYPFSRHDHLYDYGVGYGRVVYMAALYGCKKISGCELNKNYYNKVLASISGNTYSSIINSSINIVNEDAQSVELDHSINKFFFFNPFHLKIYIKVLKKILRSYEASKRPIKLFFYCPQQSTIKYLNQLSSFKLLEQANINEDYTLFLVYQIG